MLIIALIFTLLAVLIAWDYHRKKYRCEVFARSKITGPKVLPLLGCGLEMLSIGANNAIQYFGECFEKYGKHFHIFILNESQLFTRDPKCFEAILSSTTLLEKGDLYKYLRIFINDGLLLSVGRKWHARRKIFTPAFHFSVLEGYVRVFDEQSNIMAKKLEACADGKSTINMFPIVCVAALDAITETAMGVKVNAQSDHEFPYAAALKRVVYQQPDRMFKITQRYDWLYKLTAPGEYRQLMNDIKIMHDFTTKVIEERRAELERSIAAGTYKPLVIGDDEIGAKKQMALLDILLQASISGKTLTNEDIREEVDTFIFEGDDTTTSGVSHALHCISRHPEVQQKIFEEIRHVIGDDKTTPVSIKQLQDLKYLECVIKETIRLHPPVPAIGRKTHKDVVIDDIVIPANTSVYLVIFYANRDPDIFPDPLKFKPERFLDSEEMMETKRNPYAYVPFSAGPKNCIGQKFAILEMKAMISKMLRYYELLPFGPAVEPMLNFILRSSTGANIGLKPRIY